jgi:hypothetical protein
MGYSRCLIYLLLYDSLTFVCLSGLLLYCCPSKVVSRLDVARPLVCVYLFDLSLLRNVLYRNAQPVFMRYLVHNFSIHVMLNKSNRHILSWRHCF